MRFTIRFLAAAGLAVAAVPAGADPNAGVGQDAFVGLRWNEAPHTGALGSAAVAQTGLAIANDAFVGLRWNEAPHTRALAVAQPRLAVTADAFVGTRWSDAPSAEALSAVASPAAAPGPRSSTRACTCLARAE
jgi:hypothetical protein